MKSLISATKIQSEGPLTFFEKLKCEKVKANSVITYSGQVSFAALYIKSGSVVLKKKNKIKGQIHEGNLILYKEFLNKIPMKFDIELEADSEIIWLNKDQLQPLMLFYKISTTNFSQ